MPNEKSIFRSEARNEIIILINHLQKAQLRCTNLKLIGIAALGTR